MLSLLAATCLLALYVGMPSKHIIPVLLLNSGLCALIVSFPYRVSPLEVEAALASCPGVTQVAVTDIAVKEDARLIMAFYTAPKALDPAALDAHARARLAAYKCPRGYFHVESLPVGANGKLLRRALYRLR